MRRCIAIGILALLACDQPPPQPECIEKIACYEECVTWSVQLGERACAEECDLRNELPGWDERARMSESYDFARRGREILAQCIREAAN